MTKPRAQRFLRAAPILLLLLALAPLRLTGQSAPQQPSSWADEVLKQEAYAQPPKELADAVLAPRHLNVTLANLSPDKKWFVDEIGDGPVLMKTFSKPFHELGGVFIDYKANRARALTIRSNVGIQLISAADGTKAHDRRRRPARASRTRPGRPTAPASPISRTPRTRRTSGSRTSPPASRASSPRRRCSRRWSRASSSPPTASRSPRC